MILTKKLGNSLVLFIQRILFIGTPTIIGFVIARIHGDEVFGFFVFTVATITGLQLVTEFGLDKYLPGKLIKNKNSYEEVLAKWLSFKLCLSLLAYSFILFITIFFNFELLLKLSLLVYGLNLFIYSYSSTIRSKYLAFENFNIVGLSTAFFAFISVLLVYLNIKFFDNSIVSVFAMLVIGGIGELIILIFPIRNSKWLIKVKISNILKDFPKIWDYGLPVILAVIYTRISIYMLGSYGGSVAIAEYSKAASIYSALSLLPSAYAMSVYPAFVRCHLNGDVREFINLVLYNVKIISFINIPIVLCIYFFSSEVINLVYGEQSSPISSQVLKILSISYLFVVLNNFIAIILYSKELKTKIAYTSVLNMLFCFIINFLLVPNYLVYGAGFSTLFSEIITLLLLCGLILFNFKRKEFYK